MYIPEHVKSIITKEKGYALIANKDINENEIVLPLKGVIKKRSESTPDAVQIDDDKFIDSDGRCAEDHINHSCEPSTRIDFHSMNFVALKNIKKEEEITYNYLTTEYDLVKENLDFDCKCGSKNCLGEIKGFKFLNELQRLELKPLLSPFLRTI
jgi:SET domain-containing protein